MSRGGWSPVVPESIGVQDVSSEKVTISQRGRSEVFTPW